MPSAIDDLPPPGASTSGGIDDLPPPDGGGFINSVARGVGKVANAIDSYTGAPTRAAIYAAQNAKPSADNGLIGNIGNEISDAGNAAWKQFGADPSTAPSGRDIAVKAGVNDSDTRPVYAGKAGRLPGYSSADLGGMVIDAAANPLNVIPVGEIAGGVVKGAGKLAGGAIDLAGDASKWGATKLLSSLGGVKPETIREYAQFADRINAAPSVDALKEVSDNFVGKLASDVDAGKLNVQQSQDAFNGFKSDLKDTFKTAGYDARDALTSAQQTLKDAHSSNLKNLSSDVYDTVNQLKSDVQAGSGKALDTLDKSGAMVDLKPVYSKLDENIASLQKSGTDESLAVANKLQAYKDRLAANHGEAIMGPDAKKLIQGIDKTTTYSPMAGSFDKIQNGAFKDIRATLDESLKGQVDEYKKAMIPVAADTDLLNRVSQFGDKQSGAGLLSRLENPNQLENKAALQELGKKYSADFVSSAKPENLPQQSLVDAAQARVDALRPDKVADNIEQTLANSRQKSGLDAAQSNLDQAEQKLAPFKSLAPNAADQTMAQQKLNQLGKGADKGGGIELTDMFSRLGKLTDTDFVQAMKDRDVLAAFQKGATNGSRNTLMGTVVGWAFGGEHGALIGAAAGRGVDQWGPAITKRVLDGAIAVSKNPTIETIRSLSLPPEIKANMAAGLQQYLSKGAVFAGSGMAANNASNSRNNGDVAKQNQANRTPAVGEDKWAQQGIQSLGISDPAMTQKLLSDPKAKQLLIQASDLKPGSKAMKKIMDQINTGWGSQ